MQQLSRLCRLKREQKTVFLLLTSETCVDGNLCTQETEDNRKHDGMEWITRWEQENRGGNTSERQLHEPIIKTTCLHVCNPVFLWLWRPSLWNERLCFLFCGPKGKAGVKSGDAMVKGYYADGRVAVLPSWHQYRKWPEMKKKHQMFLVNKL